LLSLLQKLFQMFFNNNFVSVNDILINNEILETKFSCDLSICKGACCTMESEYAAPLKEEEIEIINSILPVVLQYLPARHKKEIMVNNFFESKEDQFVTRSVENKSCVFVYFDGDIAKCAIEKAYFDKKIEFRKPISCHLFPIRVTSFGGDVLKYEKYTGCTPALKKGEIENVSILEFCKESLIRLYGEDWYKKIYEKS
jgi:hypothetical protein